MTYGTFLEGAVYNKKILPDASQIVSKSLIIIHLNNNKFRSIVLPYNKTK